MQLAFLHGLESGPRGGKVRSLSARWPDLISPDCEGLVDVDDRLETVKRSLSDAGPLLLVGSSFGGLVAALLADERARLGATGLDIRGLVLCAPALQVAAAEAITACPVPCVLIHGRGDTVVPIAASRAFAARFGCTLVEVEDGHRLAASHGRLVDEVARLLASVEVSR